MATLIQYLEYKSTDTQEWHTGNEMEQTTVQLRTVTGELAPMLGKGRVTLDVGGLSVDVTVWVVQVQDPCILGLDFLRSARCLLDLGKNTLTFPGGPTVKLTLPTQSPKPHPLVRTAMETHCLDTKTPVERNTPPVCSFLPLVPHAPSNGQPLHTPIHLPQSSQLQRGRWTGCRQ